MLNSYPELTMPLDKYEMTVTVGKWMLYLFDYHLVLSPEYKEVLHAYIDALLDILSEETFLEEPEC